MGERTAEQDPRIAVIVFDGGYDREFVTRARVFELLSAQQLRYGLTRAETLATLRREFGTAPTDLHPLTRVWADEWEREEMAEA